MTVAIIIFSILVIIFGYVVFWGAPYVPSHRRETKEAFRVLHPLSQKDVVIDLGSGDGVILRTVAASGAKAIGYELNPILALISRLLSRQFPNIQVQTANFWHQDFPADTTLVYAFSVSRDMAKMTQKLQHEANRLGRPVHLILYAMKLPTKKPTRVHRAHTLYTFTPLHLPEA